jgi:hypothetical protein
MRVNEIVREERLDEIAPLALAGMAVSAVMVGLKAMTIYDLYDNLSRNGYDIDNMSEEDLTSFFIDLIILLVPGAGRFTNAMLMKILPAWVKRQGAKMVGEHLKTKAAELRKMKNDNRKKYANTAATPPKQAAKKNKKLTKANKKLDAEYQAVGKQLAAEKLKGVAYTVIGTIGVVPLVYTYYGKLDELDKQYTAHKGGDRTTEIFGTMNDTEAYNHYMKTRNKYIGELTVGVLGAISALPIANRAKSFKELIGPGGLMKLPLKIMRRLGGPAIPLLMQTEQGQKFLSSTIVGGITGALGSITNMLVNLLAQGLDLVLGMVGIDSNVQGAVKPQEPAPGASKGQDPLDIYGLKLYSDPKDPNKKFVRGQLVTTPNGFLRNDIKTLAKMIKDDATTFKVPNPLDQIQKDPNLQYSY